MKIVARSFLVSASVVLLMAVAAAALPSVTRIEGEAVMRAPGSGGWRDVGVGTEFPEGARVQTRVGSRLEARLDDGSVVTLRENTIFEVVRSRARRLEFRLWVGAMRNQVRTLEPGAVYRVTTPVAAAGVRGTDFELTTADDGTTGITVNDGLVNFSSTISDQETLVGAGQASTASTSGDISDPSESGSSSRSEYWSSSSSTGDASSTGGSISITSPSDGSVISARTVTVMGTAAPGSALLINGQPVTADAGGSFSSVLTLSDGVNVISVSTTDGSSQSSVTVTVDASAPPVEVSDYPELTNEPMVSLNVSTKPGATVSAGSVVSSAPGGQATLQVPLVEGENLITISAVDEAGLTGERTIRIVLDTLPPDLVVSLLTPTAGGVRVSGRSEADATVTANGYPLEVRSDGSFDDLVTWTSGSITFEAADLAGNVTRDLQNVSGAVDVDPPTLVSFTFSPSVVSAGSSATVNLEVSDVSDVIPSVNLTLLSPSGQSISTVLYASGSTYTGTLDIPSTATSGAYAPTSVMLADILGNATNVSPSSALTVSNPAPSAPSGVSAVDAATGGRVTLSWSPLSEADLLQYNVKMAYSSGGPYTLLGTTTSASYSLTGLVDGTTYYFVVSGTDLTGAEGLPSAEASVTPSDQAAPSTPGGLSASASSSSSIDLSWSPSSEAASYNVYRSLSGAGGAPWALIGNTSSTSYTVTGLASGTTYYFSVTALDDNSAPPSGTPNESNEGDNSASATTF